MKQVPALKIDGITIGQSVSAVLGRPLQGVVPEGEGLTAHPCLCMATAPSS